MRRSACALLLTLLATTALNAQDASARVDELFRQWDTRTTPGAAVLVLQRGVAVHAQGYGMADLEHGVAIDTRTVFDIASVSKQFGAMAIALLEAEGRLTLDDDVRRHLPELHDFGAVITIRHLVHHTSGIRDWPGTLRIAGWDYQDVLSYDQILRMAFAQRELNFRPGTEYAYSNTGYNLLAEIVRRVSGRSFREFTEERIFRPLGMRDTHFHDDHTMIVPRRAASYRRTADGTYRHVPNNLTALGSSSLFTTVEDLARWVANFGAGTVGGARVVARTHQRGVLARGDTIAYAFGQSVGTYRGVPSVSHTGSWAGYRTILQRFPQHDLAIIILANTAEINTTMLAQRIADSYLGTAAAPAAVTAPVTRAADAPAPPRWTPSADELHQLAGTYTSAELMTAWSLTVRDGRLVAAHFRAGDVPLQPTTRDRFQAGLFGEMRFERDAAGRVTGFTANAERVRGLRFLRQN
ncbi:MAG TPA: serine hydrolase domain-containing protein [Longimicrobiales bacterium]|nr:serine hydrolase domain-containing protein [Longimicrobiales bacterium]